MKAELERGEPKKGKEKKKDKRQERRPDPHNPLKRPPEHKGPPEDLPHGEKPVDPDNDLPPKD